MRILTLSLLLTSFCTLAHDMVPGTAQQQAILFTHATVHTASNGVLENTNVLVENGRIKAMGEQVQAADARVIDATGKHLYPGLIALDTQVGMVEIEMVRPTVDTYDVGLNNAELKASAVFNPDSEIIPTLRKNGITHAQIVPRGELLAGQSALVNLDSWTVEDALVNTPKALHLYWPELGNLPVKEEERTKALTSHSEALAQIDTLFTQARAFVARKAAEPGLTHRRFEAMAPLFSGEAKLFLHANTAGAIGEVLAFIEKYRLKAVLVGGYEAWHHGDAIKAAGVAVVYPSVFSLPRYRDDNIDEAFSIPARLANAGIDFAIGYSGDWDARNLPYAAGYAAAHGLSKEAALKAVTLNAARILGVSDMGAIEVGYRANLVLSAGDILDPLSSRIERVFIDGREITLKTRADQLYQKYLKR
ncbi:amidohydrolase family protein [Shewanella litorisediminis]|uniref:Amidohydrolase family protein n=1 Tax=Shewanella litorisediminis TaxID=1173586 RepID=A0ABX7G6B6_9GAMM|nr:amidohydrolase family protein [Shewanella litorisediminis]MCL2916931.1 amidohydrolase family protein [Shewanella litorisediminis]QRH02906.1 amidohydrolase family protein [Shewanella litorisediminis]